MHVQPREHNARSIFARFRELECDLKLDLIPVNPIMGLCRKQRQSIKVG
jgi:hypothetical protein